MFYQSAVSDSEEIVKGGMDAAKVALADAEYEIPLSQNPMNALVVDMPAALVYGFQCGPECEYAIAHSRIVLGVGDLFDIVRQSVELPTHKHGFDEGPNEGAVAFRQFEISGLGWPVHHAAP